MRNSRFTFLLITLCLMTNSTKTFDFNDAWEWTKFLVGGTAVAVTTSVIMPLISGASASAGQIAVTVGSQYVKENYLNPSAQEEANLNNTLKSTENTEHTIAHNIEQTVSQHYQGLSQELGVLEHAYKNASFTYPNKTERKIKKAKLKSRMRAIAEEMANLDETDYKNLCDQEERLSAKEKNPKLTQEEQSDIAIKKRNIIAEKEKLAARIAEDKKKEEKIREKDKKTPAKPQEPKISLYSKFIAKCALIQTAAGQGLDFLASKSFAHITNMDCFKDTAIQTHVQTINRALVITSIAALAYGSHKLYKKYSGDNDDEDDENGFND